MLPPALTRRSSRITSPFAILAAPRGPALRGSDCLTGLLLGHTESPSVPPIGSGCLVARSGLAVTAPERPRALRRSCNRSAGQGITNSVKGRRTEATVKVVPAPRVLCCPRSGGSRHPSRLKAGNAPAERRQARHQGFRGAAVASCTAAVVASMVLVGTSSAAAVGRTAPGPGPVGGWPRAGEPRPGTGWPSGCN